MRTKIVSLKKITLLFYFFLVSSICYGQVIFADKTIRLSGKILEEKSKQSLEYATVSIQKVGDNKIIGTTTDENGDFKINKPLLYYGAPHLC